MNIRLPKLYYWLLCGVVGYSLYILFTLNMAVERQLQSRWQAEVLDLTLDEAEFDALTEMVGDQLVLLKETDGDIWYLHDPQLKTSRYLEDGQGLAPGPGGEKHVLIGLREGRTSKMLGDERQLNQSTYQVTGIYFQPAFMGSWEDGPAYLLRLDQAPRPATYDLLFFEPSPTTLAQVQARYGHHPGFRLQTADRVWVPLGLPRVINRPNLVTLTFILVLAAVSLLFLVHYGYFLAQAELIILCCHYLTYRQFLVYALWNWQIRGWLLANLVLMGCLAWWTNWTYALASLLFLPLYVLSLGGILSLIWRRYRYV